MIVERGRGRDIIIRGRNKNKERYEKTISGYWPYAFVSDEDAEHIEEAVKKESGYKGLYGEDLTKITCATPYDVKQLSYYGTTWEANIPYVNRVLSDYINDGNEPIENYNHRTWYMDCEWSPTTNKMRVMVVYDSFTKKEYVWFVETTLAEQGLKDGQGKPYKEYGEYKYETPAMGFATERDMLIHFLRHMKKQDPDIIAGWYVVGADIKQIMERCRHNGLSELSLSPMGRVRYEFKDWSQPIVGRNLE